MAAANLSKLYRLANVRWMIPSVIWFVAITAVADQRSFLIENTNLLTMTANSVDPSMDVYVLDGKIRKIGPHPMDGLPANLLRIDGTGRYLMPGLIDSHIHVWKDPDARVNDEFAAQRLLVHGVTRARVAFGESEIIPWRNAVEEGTAPGAKLILSSPYITTSVETEDFILSNPSPDQAREAIQAFRKQGYDYVKVVQLHDVETLEAIQDQASKSGLRVMGHYPNVDFPLESVAKSSWVSIEHFDIFMQDQREKMGEEFDIETVVSKLNKTKTAVTTVGLLFEDDITRDSTIGRDLKVFVKLGGTLLAGTEGNFGPGGLGNTLHLELAKLSTLGLSNFEVLKTATVNAGAYLSKNDNIGVIEVGYEADLILVGDDPLDNLDSLRELSGIAVAGRWYDRNKLDEIREILSAQIDQ